MSIKCLLVTSWLGGGRWQLIGRETQGIGADHGTFSTLPQTFLLSQSLCFLLSEAWWAIWFFGLWAQGLLCNFLGLNFVVINLDMGDLPWIGLRSIFVLLA